MKYFIFFFLFFVTCFESNAQKVRKFSLDLSYGLNGNFFVRSYTESGGLGPPNETYLYKKNFLGDVAGIELKYRLDSTSSLNAGYSRSANKAKKNYEGIINGVDVFVRDFNIRHHNDFFHLSYERRFKKSNPAFKYHIGLVYQKAQQQEISIERYFNAVVIDERNYTNSGLEEGGFIGGVDFQKKIDTNVKLGLKIRGYYLISVQTFEALTLTPTLTFAF
jgi:hypothetical protein